MSVVPRNRDQGQGFDDTEPLPFGLHPLLVRDSEELVPNVAVEQTVLSSIVGWLAWGPPIGHNGSKKKLG